MIRYDGRQRETKMQYEFETIPQIWEKRSEVDADRTALHLKRHGKYESLTWSEVITDILAYVTTFEKQTQSATLRWPDPKTR